jgi:hypothetical protein
LGSSDLGTSSRLASGDFVEVVAAETDEDLSTVTSPEN